MKENYIGYDSETGGLNAGRCALLSIAAAPSWEAEPFSVFILPEGDVDAKAAEVNGYSVQAWEKKGAVPLKTAMWEFLDWLQDLAMPPRTEVVAHNAGFDLLFLQAAIARTGLEPFARAHLWQCSKMLMQECREDGRLPASGGNRLDDLGAVSGFWEKERRTDQHDALQDARCALHGFQFLNSLVRPEKKEGACCED